MTLFEYVAVAASLVCSFAVARLLSGLAPALRAGRRYWVHALWLLNLVFGISLGWWLFWSYREVEWNFFRFLLALLPLAVLYVAATVMVPANAEFVLSWQAYFDEIHFRFYGLNFAYVSANFLNSVVLLGHPVRSRGHVLMAVLAGVFAAGASSRRPAVQGSVVLAFTAVHVVAAVLAMRPGSFSGGP